MNKKKEILSRVKLLCILYRQITNLSKPIEYTIPRVNCRVNYGLLVIIMCQDRVINCNKCTTLVEDVDNGKGYVCEWGGDIWEIAVH